MVEMYDGYISVGKNVKFENKSKFSNQLLKNGIKKEHLHHSQLTLMALLAAKELHGDSALNEDILTFMIQLLSERFNTIDDVDKGIKGLFSKDEKIRKMKAFDIFNTFEGYIMFDKMVSC